MCWRRPSASRTIQTHNRSKPRYSLPSRLRSENGRRWKRGHTVIGGASPGVQVVNLPRPRRVVPHDLWRLPNSPALSPAHCPIPVDSLNVPPPGCFVQAQFAEAPCMDLSPARFAGTAGERLPIRIKRWQNLLNRHRHQSAKFQGCGGPTRSPGSARHRLPTTQSHHGESQRR